MRLIYDFFYRMLYPRKLLGMVLKKPPQEDGSFALNLKQNMEKFFGVKEEISYDLLLSFYQKPVKSFCL
ncbi:hypothetical protein SAMN02927921_02587 [Sinomicrobium oceani]|uniref:Uncharacterized protein n=1 Tax=Sinomicrobium oceani TaxID=1150368 RepID=A0A1K1QII4_9FLAO|nr:hypothetical protein SAMN02927921_02587 [Sinomicrobium oceani]